MAFKSKVKKNATFGRITTLLPDDWELALGAEFYVEKGDVADSTYLIVAPEKFTPADDNTNNGKWWPFTLVSLLP